MRWTNTPIYIIQILQKLIEIYCWTIVCLLCRFFFGGRLVQRVIKEKTTDHRTKKGETMPWNGPNNWSTHTKKKSEEANRIDVVTCALSRFKHCAEWVSLTVRLHLKQSRKSFDKNCTHIDFELPSQMRAYKVNGNNESAWKTHRARGIWTFRYHYNWLLNVFEEEYGCGGAGSHIDRPVSVQMGLIAIVRAEPSQVKTLFVRTDGDHISKSADKPEGS